MSLSLLALLLASPSGAGPQSSMPDAVRSRLFAGMPRGPMNAIMAGEILVKVRPSLADALFANSTASAARRKRALSVSPGLAIVPGGAPLSRIGRSGWTLWQIPETTDPRALAAALGANPAVVAAEPVNRIYPLIADPNDADWTVYEDDPDLIFSLEGDIEPFRRLWHLVDTNAQAGWSVWPNQYYTAGNKPADAPLIAVIDTGCDMDHPDFVNAGGRTSDAEGGGQLNKRLSARFELGDIADGAPDDLNGHGTHVTGIALAAGNSGGYPGAGDGANHGTLGTGYACQGMVLQVFDDQGIGTDADAAAAIYYAVDNGADVINLSLGTTNFSQLFQDAVTYAFQSGSLVVCAGNESGSGGGNLGPIYPAACSGALGVAANGPDGVPATDNYGGTGTYVDISAPGGDVSLNQDPTDPSYKIQYVWSTASRDPNSALHNADLTPPYNLDYAYLAGTSMATPCVSGAAGMYYGKNGLDQKSGWANLRTYRALEQSAVGLMGAPRGSWEPTQGYGALDMEALMLDKNNRDATVGAVEGIVYYNGTALANVTVRAQKPGSRIKYQTSTRQDGGYRFESLPPGVYTVTAVAFGAAKAKSATVVVGCDQTNVDFWCGTYTGDETPPTIARFDLTSYTSTGFSFRHWAYDTETSIDRMSVRIGTTPGATDVLADTELFPENPVVTQTGLTIPKFNTLQARYTNGAGMVSTATQATIPLTADAYGRNGAYASQNFGAEPYVYTKNSGVGYARHPYLKIDTSAISGAVGKFVLRVAAARIGGPSPAPRIDFFPTTSGWTETGLTWNNAPAPTGASLGSITVAGANYAWYDLDITAYVQAERAAGRPVVSVMATTAQPEDNVGIGSHENASLSPMAILSAKD